MRRESETLRLPIVVLAQAASDVRFAAPALQAHDHLRHAIPSALRFLVMVRAKLLGLGSLAAVAEDRRFRLGPCQPRLMVLKMLRLARVQFQVLRCVVLLVAVFVMHDFGRQQVASERLCHDDAVLEHGTIADANHDVTAWSQPRHCANFITLSPTPSDNPGSRRYRRTGADGATYEIRVRPFGFGKV